MKCRFCKDIDYRRSHRNSLEKILTLFLPVRPYRCQNCYRRFYGLTEPLFDLNRKITAGIMGGLILLLLSAFFMGEQNPLHLEETNKIALKSSSDVFAKKASNSTIFHF